MEVTLYVHDLKITIPNALVDTGAALTTVKTSVIEKLGLAVEANDQFVDTVGVGGIERVSAKQLHAVQIGSLMASPFMVYVSDMKYYDFDLNASIGFDFLRQVGAQMNFRTLTLTKE